MNRILILAWKNIWRNKVRSGVILGAIVIGLFAGTFSVAFMNGWMIGTVNDEIEAQLSHVQIHDAAFVANHDINACFNRDDISKGVWTYAQTNDIPMKIAFRLSLTGMLASPHNAVGITAKGVWEEEEMQVTTIWKHIPDTMGVYLTDDAKNSIVISRKIADKLKVRLRSRIIFTFQNAQGDIQSIAFRVGGIFKTSNSAFDESCAFVRYSDIFDYTGLPAGAVHEAGILLPDLETCKIIAPQLKSALPDMDVQDWTALSPALAYSLSYTDFMAVIILGIFLFALSFGIINTMLMAVLERTRELGMLGAIGMTKGRIFKMIMLETIFLTFLGSIAGIILGITIILPTMQNGIDMTPLLGDHFEDFGFSSIVYPILDKNMMIQTTILVIFAGILSAIYPARKALKLKSLEAMREG